MELSPDVLELVDFKRLEITVDDSLFFPYLMSIFETLKTYRSKEESERIIRDFFDKETIKRILTTRSIYTVDTLCETLPEAMLLEFIPLLEERIPEWKRNIVPAVAAILARNKPEAIAEFFKRIFETGKNYWDIPDAIIQVLNELPAALSAPLVSIYLSHIKSDIVRYPEDEEIKMIAYAWKLAIPERKGTLFGLFDRTSGGSTTMHAVMKCFFNTLYGPGNAQAFLYYEYQRAESPAEVMELIENMLMPEFPQQELIDLFLKGPDHFDSIMESLIQSNTDPLAVALLQDIVPCIKFIFDGKGYLQLLLTIHTIVIQSYLKKEIHLENKSLDSLLRFLCLEWNPHPFYQQIIETIATFPKEEILKQVENHPYYFMGDSGKNLIALMNDLAWPEFTSPLLVYLEEGNDDVVSTLALKVLRKMGQAVVPEIKAYWWNMYQHQKDYCSTALVQAGGEEAITFFIQTLDEVDTELPFWAGDAELCPDERTFKILEERIKQGEKDTDVKNAYYNMSVLLDKQSHLSEKIHKEFLNNGKKSKSADYPLLEEPVVIGLNLELKCLNCGHSEKYNVKQAIVHPKNLKLDPILGHDLPCASCKELNEFEFTKSAFDTVFREMDRVKSLRPKPSAKQSPIMEIEYGDACLNKNVYSYQKRHHEMVQNNPKEPLPWMDYGKFCATVGQGMKAIDCYEKALSMDKYLVEATFSLARVHAEGGNLDKALKLVNDQWENIEKWKFFDIEEQDMMFYFALDYIDFHNALLEKIGADHIPPLEVPPNLVPYEMDSQTMGTRGYGSHHSEPVHKSACPGRNDPCPCGSGKKFKKCCMN